LWDRRAQYLLALILPLLIAVETVHAEDLPERHDMLQSPSPEASQASEPANGAAAAEEGSFKWDSSWRGWEGLHFSASKKTRLPESITGLSILTFDKVELTGKLGGRLEVDAAAFTTKGNLTGFDNGIELRRARITASGESILTLPFRYKIDLGYIPKNFSVTEAYVVIPGVRYLGNVKFGQFQPPLGLQVATSSWNIPFMEVAAPLGAIGPGSQPGVQIGHPFFGDRGTWTLGVYGNVATSEYGNQAKNFGNAIGRVTWLAIDGIDTDHPFENHYLHLGASGNFEYANSGQITYRSQPESYLAPYVIDTGTINASGASTADVEVAWVNGPFSAQGEFIYSTVDPTSGGKLNFYGFYALASWYLTGESRPYDREEGDFKRLIPLRNFGFGEKGGWGAIEIAARFSYTDLTDGSVQGGRLAMLMTSLNWYLRPQLKWMFEVGAGSVHGSPSDGRMMLVQTRIGINF
jgi:phosphate-selective porin OprO/OprP